MYEELYALFQSDVRRLDSMTQRHLFRAYWMLVYNDIKFLVKDHAMVEDVIQEAFIKAMLKGPMTKEKSTMKAWLKKVAHNTALDFIRKNKHNIKNISIDYAISAALDTQLMDFNHPEQIIIEEQYSNEVLHRFLSKLKYDHRIIIYFRYIEQLSYKEISKKLGVSEQVLFKRHERARKILEKQYIIERGKINIHD